MTKRSQAARRREQERLRVEVVELRAERDRLSLLAAQVPDLAAERDHYRTRAAAHHERADALAAEVAQLRRELAHERDRCPDCVAEVTTAAVTAERDALRAILAGRTTPPTDAEIAAHHEARGRWCIADHAGAGDVRGYPPTVREIAGWHRERNATWRWIALDATGTPCAWPTTTTPTTETSR